MGGGPSKPDPLKPPCLFPCARQIAQRDLLAPLESLGQSLTVHVLSCGIIFVIFLTACLAWSLHVRRGSRERGDVEARAPCHVVSGHPQQQTDFDGVKYEKGGVYKDEHELSVERK